MGIDSRPPLLGSQFVKNSKISQHTMMFLLVLMTILYTQYNQVTSKQLLVETFDKLDTAEDYYYQGECTNKNDFEECWCNGPRWFRLDSKQGQCRNAKCHCDDPEYCPC